MKVVDVTKILKLPQYLPARFDSVYPNSDLSVL